MLHKIVILLAVPVFSSILAATPAQAQLGNILGKAITSSVMGNATPPMSNKGASSGVKGATELTARFVAAQKLMLGAQISFAKSFGLADQVKALQAARKGISSGSIDKSALEKSITLSDSVRKDIEEKMKQETPLSDSSKKEYAIGLLALTGSLSQAKKLPDAANKLIAESSGNPLSLFSTDDKLTTSLFVAKEIPGYLVALADTTKSALSFGKLMGISLPKNADALLSDL